MWTFSADGRAVIGLLAALLILGSAPAALAQGGGTDTAAEAIELHNWFEIGNRRDSLEEALGPMITAQRIQAGTAAQDGFLPSLAYSADQLTAPARNLGSGGTLRVWTNLSCQTRDLAGQASLRGVLRYQVWVQDSATGNMLRLTKIRARADGGSVFEESGIKVTQLRQGDRLWFQILRDSVSPLRNVYCTFAYGIYRAFTGDS